jgi:hypothetical protein
VSASVEVRSSPQTPPQAPPALRVAPPVARRVVRGLVFATIAADLVLLGRLTGLLDGAAGVVVGTLLVLLVPTSRELPRRVLLAGCLLLGWSEVLWWWPLTVGEPGRVTLGLAVLAGALAGWVGAAEHPGARARRLQPRLRPADVALGLPIGIGIACTSPWLAAKTPTQTLGMLMGGWDNVAHFSMVHMIRRFGAVVSAVPPPTPGATWQFASYPQGFHAVAAGVVELLIGPDDTWLGPELVAYTQAMALVVIAVTTTVVAGFCALPPVRRRPVLALPVAAFVSAVFLLGPGALAIGGGIANFAVACGLSVAVVLLVVPAARVVSPLTLAAVGGALVGVASTWVLLLALAGPALLALLLPLRRRRWAASRAQVAVSVGVAVAVVVGLAQTAVVLSQVQAASPLTVDGGRVHVDVGLVVAAALAIVGMGVALARRRPRVAALMAVPAVATATAAWLIQLQVAANGEITYYGLKFLLGAQVVLFAVLAVPVVHLLERRRRGRGRVRGVLASGIAALALTQVFGLTATALAPGIAAEAPGVTNAVKEAQSIAQPPAAADLANRIAYLDAPLPAFWIDIAGDRRVSPILAGQWFLAFTDSWTLEANAMATITTLRGPGEVPLVAERILLRRPDAVVVVRREDVAAVRRAVGPELAPRVYGL